jgi:ABC-2 type transport system permease protein
MWERILEIFRKEVRQTLREPRMRASLFMPPLIQMLIFGYSVNMDVEHARLVWVDRDHTPVSRDLLAAFEGSRRFDVIATPDSDKGAQDLLDRSRADLIVEVLPGFARDISRGKQAQVQILINGENSNTASIISGYASQIVARFSNTQIGVVQRSKMVAGTMAAGHAVSAPVPRLEEEARVWFNPELKSRNYFVPGIIVNIMVLVTLSLTSMAIVREKEIGTMEQLIVTPLRPMELIIGKTLPFALVGIVDIVVVVAAALLLFHVPFRGSAFVLALGACLFLMSSLGAGLLISTVVRTQQQAMMSTFLCFMPFFLLSGFTFPVRNMPIAAQWFTFFNPVRYFMEIVRGVFLKGAGIDVLWPQMVALTAFGVVILTAATNRFHKKLD